MRQHVEDLMKVALESRPSGDSKHPNWECPEPPAELWRYMDVNQWLNIDLKHISLRDKHPESLLHKDLTILEESL